jgi:hypothetical protein
MVGKNQTHKFHIDAQEFCHFHYKKKLEGATQSSLQTTIKYINVPSILLVTKQETRKTFTIAITNFFAKNIKNKKNKH